MKAIAAFVRKKFHATLSLIQMLLALAHKIVSA